MNPVELDASTQMINLAPHAEVLFDSEPIYSRYDVLLGAAEAAFKPVQTASVSAGYTRDVIWLRFLLHNQGAETFRGAIEMPIPWVNDLEVYLATPAQRTTKLLGSRRSFANREINARSFFIPVQIAAGETLQVHIRAAGTDAMTLAPYLYSHLNAEARRAYITHFNGALIGILTVMILYNLAIFFVLRDYDYLRYVFYLTSAIFFMGTYYGYNLQLFWPEHPEFNEKMVATTVAVFFFSGLLFARNFLNTRERMPRSDRFLRLLSWAFLALGALSFYIVDHLIVIYATVFLVSFYSIGLLGVSIASWHRREPGSGFFVLAWTLSMIASLFASIMVQGFIDYTNGFYDFYGIAVSLDLILLSFALGDRINHMQKEKVAAQSDLIDRERQISQMLSHSKADLEQQVMERTRALAASEDRFRHLFEESSDAFLLMENNRFIECNRAAVAMLRLDSREQLLNLQPEEISPPFQPDGHTSAAKAKAMIEIAQSLGSHRFEWIHYRRGEEEFPVEVLLTSIMQDERPLIHVVWRDITERKRAEEAIMAANRAKSDFLARMSHEIRTPMNAVIGLAQLALRTELTSKQRDYLDKIDHSAQALLGIINDILDFSKIEAGKLDLEQVDFDLRTVLSHLADVVTVRAEQKGVEVVLDLDPAVPAQLVGDPLRLGQVLLNMANNAVKFTDQGEVIIASRLLETDQGIAHIRFSIRDSGIGMTQSQIDNLFQAFQQADGSITRRYGGTGLGLAIAKQLVDMMGGTLKAASVPGQGSEFVLDMSFGVIAEHTESRRSLPAMLQGRSVMLIDDNAAVRRILGTMLENLAFRVTTVDSGAAALTLMAEHAAGEETPFCLVLADWNMPGLDGLNTLRQLKQQPGGAQARTMLLVTTHEYDEVARSADGAFVDRLLIKPVTQDSFRKILLDMCGETPQTPKIPITGPKFMFGGGPLDHQRPHILLVEDNPINQQVATELLEQAGLRVELAINGREGFEKATRNHYDLVLMDVQMPELDGLEATRLIRESGAGDLPIVAMTAHTMAGDRERSLEAGMNDHLSKPINLNELDKVLRRWIRLPEAGLVVDRASDRAAVDPDPSLPVTVTGLDTVRGLLQMGGGRRLYLKLLEEFAQRYREVPERLRQHLSGGELELALHLAHSIKGSASSLGAEVVARQAGALEQALRSGDGHVEELAPPVLSSVEALCLELAAWFAVQPAPFSPDEGIVPLDSPKALLLPLDQLAGLLEQGNSRAEQALEALRAAAVGWGLDAPLLAMSEAVEDVEFERALELLHRLRARIVDSI